MYVIYGGFIFVKHRVEKYIFKYEPLYVARAETPQFDERFIGFGMTRNTQVCVWKYHMRKYENIIWRRNANVVFTRLTLSGVRNVRSWLQVPPPQQCFHISLGIPGDTNDAPHSRKKNKLFRKNLQSLKSRPSWRAKQQEENNARFDEFAREVTYKSDWNLFDI